tara:strand:+ start:266 stop:376 length:111 start_codon:yes stop_codon:yes gene_type:complete
VVTVVVVVCYAHQQLGKLPEVVNTATPVKFDDEFIL